MTLLLVGSYFKRKKKKKENYEKRFGRCNSEKLNVKMDVRSRNWDISFHLVSPELGFRDFTNFILGLERKKEIKTGEM